MKRKAAQGLPFALCIVFLSSDICFATFESSLIGIKHQLTVTVLPAIAVCGLIFAAISFFSGSPNCAFRASRPPIPEDGGQGSSRSDESSVSDLRLAGLSQPFVEIHPS
jgi:hypothetical protein